jgi:O-antigen/teichoic acid export membrane protein
MSVIRTLAGTFATKGVGFVLTLLVGVMISRTLGPGGKGQVEVLVMVTMLLLIAYPSMEEPQLYVIGRGKVRPGTLFSNALIASFLFGAFCFLVLETVIRFAPGWLTYDDRSTGGRLMIEPGLLRQLLAVAPFMVAMRLCGGILQGLRDMRGFNLVFLVQNLVLALGVAALVVLGRVGIEGAVIAHMASHAAGGLTAVVLCAQRPEVRAGPRRPDAAALRHLVRDGLRIHGGVIAAFVILSSDQLILNRIRGPESVGLYATAVALTGQLRRLVVQPVKEVVGSRLPGMVGEDRRMAETLAQACRHTLLLVLAPGLALAALGYPVILVLYGARFAPAYGPLLVLLPGSVLWALAVILSYWFIGGNRLLTCTLVGVLIAATNIILNLIFIEPYGMFGAAWTSVFCYALHAAIFLALVRAFTGVGVGAFLVPRREDFQVYADAWRRIRSRVRGSR